MAKDARPRAERATGEPLAPPQRVHFAQIPVRAAESIAFNIVEGCGANSRKEFARFLDISIKSTSELEYQLQLAMDYGVLPARDWRSLTAETIEIRRMLCGLRRAVLEASRSKSDPLKT